MRKVFVSLPIAALFAAGLACAQVSTTPGSTTSGAAVTGTGGESATPSSAGPGGIPVGPLTVYPGVDLAYGHDDNLFLRPAGAGVRASDYTVVSPYVRAEAKPGPHRFELGLRVDDGRYHQSPADSYTDYALVGTGDMVFSGRSGLKLRAEFRHGHDPRGSNDRAISLAPDEYDNAGIDGLFRYGAPGARGRIEIEGSAFARRYTNNRTTTSASDRDTSKVGGTFFWRVMPRTELLGQLTYSNIDYTLGTSTQDSTETRFLVGAKWEATAATTGTAKFGRSRKEFDSPGRQNTSDSSWDVGVRWSPLTYSVFDFVTARQTNESTGFGDTILGTNYGVTWSHAWNSRLRTQALASFRTDDYKGAGVSRSDETVSFGLKVAYEMRRWLRLGAEYTYFERQSNTTGFDYKRNLMLFTVGASL